MEHLVLVIATVSNRKEISNRSVRGHTRGLRRGNKIGQWDGKRDVCFPRRRPEGLQFQVPRYFRYPATNHRANRCVKGRKAPDWFKTIDSSWCWRSCEGKLGKSGPENRGKVENRTTLSPICGRRHGHTSPVAHSYSTGRSIVT